MDKSEHEDFLTVLGDYKLKESDFEIAERTDYPKEGSVGPLYCELTIKHKSSGVSKIYKPYNEPWVVTFSDDIKANYFQTR